MFVKHSVLLIFVAALTLSSLYAQEQCQRHVEAIGGFSFCPPSSWTSSVSAGTKFNWFFQPPGAGASSGANFNVHKVTSGATLEELVQFYVNDLTNRPAEGSQPVHKLVDRKDIRNSEKVRGVRVLTQVQRQGVKMKSIIYTMAGNSDQYVILSSTMLDEDATSPKLLDEMIQTFRFEGH